MAKKNYSSEIKKIYEAHAQSIYRYAYSRLLRPADAEDVTAETFFRFLRDYEKFLSKGIKPKIWLFGIASNVLKERYRQIKKENETSSVDFEVPDAKETMEAKEISTEMKKKVADFLMDLNGEEKEVIVLKVWEDMKFTDIAKVIDTSVNSVKSRYYRGLQKIEGMFTLEEKRGKKLYAINIPAILLGIRAIKSLSEWAMDGGFKVELLKELLIKGGAVVAGILGLLMKGKIVKASGVFFSSTVGKIAAALAVTTLVTTTVAVAYLGGTDTVEPGENVIQNFVNEFVEPETKEIVEREDYLVTYIEGADVITKTLYADEEVYKFSLGETGCKSASTLSNIPESVYKVRCKRGLIIFNSQGILAEIDKDDLYFYENLDDPYEYLDVVAIDRSGRYVAFQQGGWGTSDPENSFLIIRDLEQNKDIKVLNKQIEYEYVAYGSILPYYPLHFSDDSSNLYAFLAVPAGYLSEGIYKIDVTTGQTTQLDSFDFGTQFVADQGSNSVDSNDISYATSFTESEESLIISYDLNSDKRVDTVQLSTRFYSETVADTSSSMGGVSPDGKHLLVFSYGFCIEEEVCDQSKFKNMLYNIEDGKLLIEVPSDSDAQYSTINILNDRAIYTSSIFDEDNSQRYYVMRFDTMEEIELSELRGIDILGINLLEGVYTSWNTYTNRDYGFSFEYPANWIIEESEDGAVYDSQNFNVEVTEGEYSFDLVYRPYDDDIDGAIGDGECEVSVLEIEGVKVDRKLCELKGWPNYDRQVAGYLEGEKDWFFVLGVNDEKYFYVHFNFPEEGR
ncbi:MAG TPA: RNA polymerase sigma factor, partial [bacterium]|nr:RNA polymerase sigma factor [bacterium]